MPKINVVTVDGEELNLDGTAGQYLMEVLRDGEVDDNIGLCGGVASCATCHVYVADQSNLPPLNEAEEDVLDSLDNRDDTSRLSCQIEVDDAMDGLRLVMPAEF